MTRCQEYRQKRCTVAGSLIFWYWRNYKMRHNVKQPRPLHDDVIKWRHFPCYWPFVQGIHRSPLNFPHEGQWRGALKLSLICAWINGWINNREAGDLRRHRAHYDVTVVSLALVSISDDLHRLDAYLELPDTYDKKSFVWLCIVSNSIVSLGLIPYA